MPKSARAAGPAAFWKYVQPPSRAAGQSPSSPPLAPCRRVIFTVSMLGPRGSSRANPSETGPWHVQGGCGRYVVRIHRCRSGCHFEFISFGRGVRMRIVHCAGAVLSGRIPGAPACWLTCRTHRTCCGLVRAGEAINQRSAVSTTGNWQKQRKVHTAIEVALPLAGRLMLWCRRENESRSVGRSSRHPSATPVPRAG